MINGNACFAYFNKIRGIPQRHGRGLIASVLGAKRLGNGIVTIVFFDYNFQSLPGGRCSSSANENRYAARSNT
jgi:hypothetical protein